MILGRSSKHRKASMWDSRMPSGKNSRSNHAEYSSVSKWQEKKGRGRQGLIRHLQLNAVLTRMRSHWRMLMGPWSDSQLGEAKGRSWGRNYRRITGITGSQQQCAGCCGLSPHLVVQQGKHPKGILEWSETGVSNSGGGTRGKEAVRENTTELQLKEGGW